MCPKTSKATARFKRTRTITQKNVLLREGIRISKGGFKISKGGFKISKGGFKVSKGGYQDIKGRVQDIKGRVQDIKGRVQDIKGRVSGYQREGIYQDIKGRVIGSSFPPSSKVRVRGVAEDSQSFSLRMLLRTSLATSVGGLSYVLYTDEGSRRSLQFWSNIFPIFVHYRTVQFLNRDTGILTDQYADEIYDSLHKKYANRVRDITYKMRGFYLKQAQLMSTRNDFVPAAYMEWMKDTQDNVRRNFFIKSSHLN